MGIYSITKGMPGQTGLENLQEGKADRYKEKKQAALKGDEVEISSEAYKMRKEEEKLTAASGKDTLGITKGRGDNTYVIHFSDSAMVSRAVSRGYITINGTRIDLSDEVKKQLLETDSQAQKDREKAYNQYIMQHEMAVAQQQADASKRQAEDTSKAFEIAAKMARGARVSSSEEKKLMEFNPQLYAMSKSAAMMSKRQERPEAEGIYKPEHRTINNKKPEGSVGGVDWSSFEWKSYETQLSVSLAAENSIQGVEEGEVVL